MKFLSLLAALPENFDIQVLQKGEDFVPQSIAMDSRKVTSKGVFVAFKGAIKESHDGHDFVQTAIAQGADALVLQRKLPGLEKFLGTIILVKQPSVVFAGLCEAFYGFPSRKLQVFGITGTNGKTSSALYLAQILNACGIPCASIGTLGIKSPKNSIQTGFTTPNANILSKNLADLVDEGVKVVAMEVSSHALALHRADGIRFACTSFTNLTPEHLDFHANMEVYLDSKMRLFTKLSTPSTPAVLPIDSLAIKKLKKTKTHIITFGQDSKADIFASNVVQTSRGLSFNLHNKTQTQAVTASLFGLFQVQNILCAAGQALSLGIAFNKIASTIADLKPLPGRMEPVVCSSSKLKSPAVIVDFAHTEDALKTAILSLPKTSFAKLHVVFGCGGGRDAQKRPKMGAVAAQFADYVYVTDDNPRHEDPQSIRSAILAGIGTVPSAQAVEVANRAEAIARAIANADPQDFVLIAGKGHEKVQIIGTSQTPFDDVTVAKKCLEDLKP